MRTSKYNYLTFGGQRQLDTVLIDEGYVHTTTYLNDLGGQILQRRDIEPATQNRGTPTEISYRMAGRSIGFTGNNGSTDLDYGTSIDYRLARPPGGNNFTYGAAIAAADFTQGITQISSFYQGSTGGSYEVRQGDTLASIAQGVWGDASLWWKLAEANGMSGQGGLVVGQRLTLPTGVMRSHHTSSTFDPYDPGKATGNTSPGGGPQPTPAKQGGCGGFGQVIVLIVSYVVQVILDAYLPTAGTVLGNIIRGAFIGATSNAAGQYVGVQTGIQEKFSWNQVAMAGVSGGVEGGLTNNGRGILAGDTGWQPIARSVIANAASQGVALKHHWQSKFDWAGVAGSAAIGGVSSYYHPSGSFSGIERFGAKAIAGAAARGLINGEDFGDNLRAVLPSVISSTIGEQISKQRTAEDYKRFIRAAYDHYSNRGSFLGWQMSQAVPPPDAGDTDRATNSGRNLFLQVQGGTGEYTEVPYLLRHDQWRDVPSVFDPDEARASLRLYESGSPSIVLRSGGYEEQFAPFMFGIWASDYNTSFANPAGFVDHGSISFVGVGLGLTSGASNIEVPALPKVAIQLPKNGGSWTGVTPGESGWRSSNPRVIAITGGAPVPFKGGVVDFSPWSRGFIGVDGLTGDAFLDNEKGLNALATRLSRVAMPGETVNAYRWLKERNLTLHHVMDGTGFDLIPSDLHNNVHHTGGAAVLRVPGFNPSLRANIQSLSKAAKYGGRALGVVGAAVDAWTLGTEFTTSLRTGYYGNTGVAAAGIAGGWGGAALGATWGARAGIAFGPWGILAGGVIGGFVGYWAGSTAGRGGANQIIDHFALR